jgi:aminoglycoside phosphotransferase family enzyme/predicted kinase
LARLPSHLAGLLDAAAYAHPVERIELVETHISWVLLTGAFAYKIKRPVRYDFIDLESPERRAFFCAEEVRLNRRFAPELYLDVCDIRQSANGVRVGEGAGPVIERCVRMRQFPSERQLDRLLDADAIEPASLEAFGRALAVIHARLPVALPTGEWGDPAAIQQAIERNLEEYGRAPELRQPLDALCSSLASCMQARRAAGRIRECHGDLHARNVALLDAGLVAFDCIEFQPAFRWIDVAEEIALLLADLASRDRPQHAHAFLAGYTGESGDYQACRVLPLYRAHRALVRAKVNALEARTASGEHAANRQRRHDRLLEEARAALDRKSPRLILMAGLSGSGKTWLARQLAPKLRAIHLRSDIERKRRAGLDAAASSGSAVGGGLYTEESTRDLYDWLAQCAEDVLAGGYDVIVDATFLKRSTRQVFGALARRVNIPLVVLLCEAPLNVLRDRVQQRQRASKDASEANADVLEWQLGEREAIDPDEGLRVVHLDATGDDVFARAVEVLRQ